MKRRTGKTFVIPTRNGLQFGFVVTAMFIAASAYANNLLYLLTFVIFSVGIASLIMTHFNLEGLDIESIDIAPSFATNPTTITVSLANRSSESRLHVDLYLRIAGGDYRIRCHRVDPQASRSFSASVVFTRRGLFLVEVVTTHTVYPIGLWYSWRWHSSSSQALVYPEPIGDKVLVIHAGQSESTESPRRAASEDLGDHRRAEALSTRTDWKLYAKRGEPWERTFEEAPRSRAVIPFDPSHDLEAALSQASLWLRECQQKNMDVSLHIHGQEYRDPRHALKELAIYGQ